ncbi:unnamed protein product [Protopolystoma xenopodis]|uniref:Uncharacterized protein n=1 Tax=Protopolystoma xenopodis TaxID=117903 RepID=A0A448XIA8_9PLAT|nr:unnamed protein product [Protopolystoma xenopodis]
MGIPSIHTIQGRMEETGGQVLSPRSVFKPAVLYSQTLLPKPDFGSTNFNPLQEEPNRAASTVKMETHDVCAYQQLGRQTKQN